MDFTKLSDFMEHLVNWRIPGCSCIVYKDREKVFTHSAGYRDIDSKTAMKGDELFYMYSATKPVVCASALTLWEAGKFDLDDEVAKYLPEWSDMKVRKNNPDGTFELVPAQNKARVRDLFSMTAGLDYMTETEAMKKAIEVTAPLCPTREIVRAIADRPLHFEPGTHWNYSLCHDVLGGLVEVIADMPLADYVKKAILDPVGMNDTEFGLREERRSRLATEYSFNDATNSIEKIPDQGNWAIFGSDYHSGGAGLVSTVSDMALFTEMMAAGGKAQDGKKVLAPTTIDLMKRNQLDAEAMKDFNWSHLKGYGYGLGVRTMVDPALGASPSPVGEFGWTGAAGAYMMIDTDNRLAVFYAHHMLNNQEYYTAPRLRNIVYSCLD